MSAKIKDSAVRNEEEEKNWPQIVAILIGSLAGFTEGLFFAWTSPFLTQIVEEDYYDINKEQFSFFNTIYAIGMVISCPIFAVLSDKIGRKKTFLLSTIPQLLSWLLAAFGRDVYFFYASRFCSGISVGCFYSVFTIYIGEISNPNVRGSWGNALATSMYCGELAINIIGSYFTVQETSYICLPLPILFAALFSMMPESPYFYIMKGMEKEAKNSLRFLKRKKFVEKDYLKLKADVERQISESGTWKDLFVISSNRKAIVAGIFLRVSQQTTGLTVFLQYTQLIFQKSRQDLSHQLASVIFGTLNVVLNILVLFFMVNRYQRRTLYIMSLVSSAITLYVLATYLFIEGNFNFDLSLYNWMPITSIILYMTCASFGISVIPTLMMSELFSASIKAKAMILLVVVLGSGILLLNNIFYYINEFFGFHAPFYFFAISNTITSVLSFYYIPETKGKTLEEIQQILKRDK